jgi:hypothetical protein
MKILLIVVPILALGGCSVSVKSCDPAKSASVFESKKLTINKVIDFKNINKVILKSFVVPTVVREPKNKMIFLIGKEEVSVVGYQTDECRARETVKRIKNAKPSLDFTQSRQGSILVIETTGERKFIHHQNAFSSIRILLPKDINYKYIHSPLKRRSTTPALSR